MLSEASLGDLNARLTTPLPIDRFRPNLVLSGVDAYDEDYIDQIVSGDVTLKMVKPCTRCQVTTIDQKTLERGVEPLRTLATYRHNALLDGVAFGMNAIVAPARVRRWRVLRRSRIRIGSSPRLRLPGARDARGR